MHAPKIIQCIVRSAYLCMLVVNEMKECLSARPEHCEAGEHLKDRMREQYCELVCRGQRDYLIALGMRRKEMSCLYSDSHHSNYCGFYIHANTSVLCKLN